MEIDHWAALDSLGLVLWLRHREHMSKNLTMSSNQRAVNAEKRKRVFRTQNHASVVEPAKYNVQEAVSIVDGRLHTRDQTADLVGYP